MVDVPQWPMADSVLVEIPSRIEEVLHWVFAGVPMQGGKLFDSKRIIWYTQKKKGSATGVSEGKEAKKERLASVMSSPYEDDMCNHELGRLDNLLFLYEGEHFPEATQRLYHARQLVIASARQLVGLEPGDVCEPINPEGGHWYVEAKSGGFVIISHRESRIYACVASSETVHLLRRHLRDCTPCVDLISDPRAEWHFFREGKREGGVLSLNQVMEAVQSVIDSLGGGGGADGQQQKQEQQQERRQEQQGVVNSLGGDGGADGQQEQKQEQEQQVRRKRKKEEEEEEEGIEELS